MAVSGFRGCLPVPLCSLCKCGSHLLPWESDTVTATTGTCWQPVSVQLSIPGEETARTWLLIRGSIFPKGLYIKDKSISRRLRGSLSLISTPGKAPVSLEFSLIDIPTPSHKLIPRHQSASGQALFQCWAPWGVNPGTHQR